MAAVAAMAAGLPPLIFRAIRAIRAIRIYLLGVEVEVVTGIWAGPGKHIRFPTKILPSAPLESSVAALIHCPGAPLPVGGRSIHASITRLECVPERGWLRPALLRLLRWATSGRVGFSSERVEAALPRLGLAGSSRCPKYRRPRLDGLATLSLEHRTLRWMLAYAEARVFVVNRAARLVALVAAMGPVRDQLQARRSSVFVDLRITPIHDGDKRGLATDVTALEWTPRPDSDDNSDGYDCM